MHLVCVCEVLTRTQCSAVEFAILVLYCKENPTNRILLPPCRVVVFVDEDNGDVDNIPSDGEGLDGDDETSDESEADSSSDVS